MTAQEFTDAVKAMVGLPPTMMERLVFLGPKLTEDERSDALKQLGPIHEDILQTGKEIMDEADAGEAEMQKFQKEELPKMRAVVEEQERAAAEHILGDDTGGATSPLT